MANDFMRISKKVGPKSYEETYYSDNREHALEMYASYMTAKYLHKVGWIKRVKDEPNYAEGGRVITFHTVDCGEQEFRVEFHMHRL